MREFQLQNQEHNRGGLLFLQDMFPSNENSCSTCISPFAEICQYPMFRNKGEEDRQVVTYVPLRILLGEVFCLWHNAIRMTVVANMRSLQISGGPSTRHPGNVDS